MGTEDQKSPAGVSSPEQQRLLVTHEEAAKALNGTRDTSKLEVRHVEFRKCHAACEIMLLTLWVSHSR